MDLVTLFVDTQNAYFSARENFGGGFHTNGQFDPIALGELLCNRPPPGHERTLHEVRIYTGQHARQRLQVTINGRRSWCHMLGREVYDAVADTTDYNVA